MQPNTLCLLLAVLAPNTLAAPAPPPPHVAREALAAPGPPVLPKMPKVGHPPQVPREAHAAPGPPVLPKMPKVGHPPHLPRWFGAALSSATTNFVADEIVKAHPDTYFTANEEYHHKTARAAAAVASPAPEPWPTSWPLGAKGTALYPKNYRPKIQLAAGPGRRDVAAGATSAADVAPTAAQVSARGPSGPLDVNGGESIATKLQTVVETQVLEERRNKFVWKDEDEVDGGLYARIDESDDSDADDKYRDHGDRVVQKRGDDTVAYSEGDELEAGGSGEVKERADEGDDGEDGGEGVDGDNGDSEGDGGQGGAGDGGEDGNDGDEGDDDKKKTAAAAIAALSFGQRLDYMM